MLKRIKNSNLFNFLLLLIVMIFVGRASNIYAGTIGFYPSTQNSNVGSIIRARVVIDSSVSINAVSSRISYPTDMLSLTTISKSGSLVSLWAQEPSFSNINGTASLEGVILNGYTGNGGNIVTLVFKALKEGQAEVKFNGASILANDGNGTETIIGSNSTIINISKAIEKPKKEIPVKESTVVEKVVESCKDAVVQVREVEKVNNLPDYSLVIIIMIIIIILLILLILYGIYYLNKAKKYLKKKLIRTEEDVLNKFESLEKDIYKEAIITKKLENDEKLNEDERTALVDFKKDIKKAQKEIIEEIKELEQNN